MRHPNILLIILDATRADACSCYGCKRLTTPALDQLAQEGVLYEQAISTAPWTLPAVASVFTGLYPGQLGVYLGFRLEQSFPTLAQLLAEHGYATFGITNNSWLSADFGLQRGFGIMHKQWQLLQHQRDINKLVLMQDSQGSNWTRTVVRQLVQGNFFKNIVNAAFTHLVAYRRDLGASRILGPFARWVESQREPWFAFVHYMEAHLPYKPPIKWAARFVDDLERAKKWIRADQWRADWHHITGVELLSEADLKVWRDLYLAEVAYADHHLGLLVNWLRQTERLDNTLVIIVADHGESLGEHGLLNHRYCVYDTLLRVPLVIRYPPLFPTNHRVSYQVQTLDLFKTVLDIAGITALPSASQSLLSENGRRSFTVAECGIPRTPHPRDLARLSLRKEQLSRFERGLTALRTDTHKLIVGTDESVELYAWLDDPDEMNNLAFQQPEMVTTLRNMLGQWQEEHQTPQDKEAQEGWEVDPATEARLRALGYIG